MRNKKLFIAVAALSLVTLAACNDDIVAKPTDYKDNIVDVEGNDDIFNNVMGTVYDKIREGGIGSEALNDILFEYAVSVVGDYEELKAAATGNDSAKDAFVDAHKAYQAKDADDTLDKAQSRARVEAKFDTIEKRIKTKMYDDISGKADSRHIFSEEDYVHTLKASMYDVKLDEPTGGFFKGIIDVAYEKEDVFEQFLHRDLYEGYIKDELLPDIYRQLLVEQYILDESYNAIGRSFGRQVNVLSITANSDHVKAAPYLMNYFANEKVAKGAYANADEVLAAFKQVSNIWKGVNLTDEEKALATASKGFTSVGTGADQYFEETEYGDLKYNYDLIKNNPLLNNSEQESVFTGGNKYTKEVGLEIKSREIQLHDYTTTGWFIKNGGLTSLPETIRNRLFNINVANAVNELENKNLSAADKAKYDRTSATYEKDYNSYVALINGVYYLKTSSTNGDSSSSDILFYDSSSSAYHIVQISEAVSSSRLDANSNDRYELIRENGSDVMETIINEVVSLVADNESYKTLSNKHWLEESGLVYHDTTVYDYFKSNYPELFED